MSAVQNCLNRSLFLPNLWGSFIFNFNGQLRHICIIRIILSLFAFVYFCTFEEFPKNIDFRCFIAITENLLICSTVVMLLRACWLTNDFRASLELMESVSGFIDISEIKLIVWPSVISNIVITAVVSYKSYKFSKSPLYFFSSLQTLLLLNAFSDEVSTMLLLLRFLSDSLNTHLATVINRDSLVSLLKAQNMLCSAVRRINNLYSVQILFLMALSFFCSISFTFLFIHESLLYHIDSFTLLLWVISFLQFSVKIILSASSLTNSVQNFDIHIYEILKARPPSWTPLVLVEDLMFDRTIKLTAAGCFDLSIENLGSMISIATTYLVLLIQMD